MQEILLVNLFHFRRSTSTWRRRPQVSVGALITGGTMQLRSSLAVAALAGLSLAACSDATSVGGNGTLAVRLTDAPFPTDSVKSVDVFVVRVDVKQDDATDSTAANTDATDTTVSASEARDGWQTIATPDSLIDLLTLQNGISTALGQASLKAGTYHAMRLVIDPDSSSITMLDGTVLTPRSRASRCSSRSRSTCRRARRPRSPRTLTSVRASCSAARASPRQVCRSSRSSASSR
jgi:uncharacterized protein DUF4382